MITLYTGELLISPVPLEMSLHRCNYGCAYCFATLNYRHTKYAFQPKDIMNQLTRYPNQRNLVAELLKRKYPVLISNHTDPLCPANRHVILPVLDMLASQDIPVAFQTRGGNGWEDLAARVAPSCWYVTLTTDQPDIHRVVEPGSPFMDDVLRMVSSLTAQGHVVSIGVNPFVPGWIRDIPGFLQKLKDSGVHGVWSQLLHLHYRQRNHLQPREREALGENLITLAMKRNTPESWIQAITDFADQVRASGLAFYTGSQHEESDYFTPYSRLYKKTFPTYQGFINHLHQTRRDPCHLISFEEWWAFCVPLLPSCAFSGMSKYIGSTNHDFFWDFKVPDKMTYKQLFKLLWDYPQLKLSPPGFSSFAFPARWDEEEPAGWIQYVSQAWEHLLSFQPEGCLDYYKPMEKDRLSV